MKTVAIIQGRMGSSRLPGKVLLEIAGKPMIQHVIERTQHARTLNAVTIATTTDPSDDPVAAFAVSIGIPHTRGSLHDVLDRYYQAAKIHQADVIVRITADCPLIDPEVIDQTVNLVTNSAFSRLSPAPFPSAWMWKSALLPHLNAPGRKPPKPSTANTSCHFCTKGRLLNGTYHHPVGCNRL
jgi:spore coat polysaccharide biosynthesis protein SpsF (cytidylyltransferase family)